GFAQPQPAPAPFPGAPVPPAPRGFAQPQPPPVPGVPVAPAPPPPAPQGRSMEKRAIPRLLKSEASQTSNEKTYATLEPPEPADEKDIIPVGAILFAETDLFHVLDVYQNLSHRSLIHSTALPAAKISFQNETPLTRHEALQALDSVLVQNGVTM